MALSPTNTIAPRKNLRRANKSYSDDHYEEPDYDPEEPMEPDFEDPDTANDENNLNLDGNLDALAVRGNEERRVVDSGDVPANVQAGEKAPKSMKIPNEERITTPYMTKYERARVLGVRALQIRYVSGC